MRGRRLSRISPAKSGQKEAHEKSALKLNVKESLIKTLENPRENDKRSRIKRREETKSLDITSPIKDLKVGKPSSSSPSKIKRVVSRDSVSILDVNQVIKSARKPKTKKDENNLKLLQLDETFTKDNFGNKTFPATLSPAESLSFSLNSSRSSLSQSLRRSKTKTGSDNENPLIEELLNKQNSSDDVETLEKTRNRLKTDRMLNAIFLHDDWFRENLIRALFAFSNLSAVSGTQASVWILLARVSTAEHRTEADILTNAGIVAFVKDICKLSFQLLITDQVLVTAVLDTAQTEDEKPEAVIVFEQFDLTLPRNKLESCDLAVFQEQSPYNNDVGNFIEVNFVDMRIVEFLAAVHIHLQDKDCEDIPNCNLKRMLPMLCGLASTSKEPEQKIVGRLLEVLSEHKPGREPEHYMRQRSLQELWSQDIHLFLNSVYEGRMRKIHLRPPVNEEQLIFAETQLSSYDILSLAHYINYFDRKSVPLSSIILTDCGLNDESLIILGRKIWKLKSVKISGGNFSGSGIQELTRKLTGETVKRCVKS